MRILLQLTNMIKEIINTCKKKISMNIRRKSIFLKTNHRNRLKKSDPDFDFEKKLVFNRLNWVKLLIFYKMYADRHH